jgi:hypothetical protein
MAYVPPHLPLLAGRDRGSLEGASGTDASCLDPDDDECLRTGHGGNETPGKQSGCWTGIRPQLAGIRSSRFRCDRAINCSCSLLGDIGDLPERAKSCKLLKDLVAGGGCEHRTPFRLSVGHANRIHAKR